MSSRSRVVLPAVLALVAGVMLNATPAAADGPVSSRLTVDAPSQVARGAHVDATGVLTTDPGDQAIAGATLDWHADCVATGFSALASGQTTTAADGTYLVTYDPAYCIQARLTVTWDHAAAADHDRVSVDTGVPWRLAQITGDLPSQIYVNDVAIGHAVYTVDGVPQSGVHLDVSVMAPGQSGWNPPLSQDDLTDADGVMSFRVPTYLAGSFQVLITASPTADTAPASWQGAGASDQMPTRISLAADHETITEGQEILLSGAVSRDDAQYTDVDLGLYENDHDGSGWRPVMNLGGPDAQGSFSVQKILPIAGVVSFRVSNESDPSSRYLSGQSPTIDVTVRRIVPTLTLSTDKDTYLAGDIATITAGVCCTSPTDQFPLSMSLTATPPFGDSGRLLFTGTDTGEGITLRTEMTQTSRITLTTPGDSNHESGQQDVVVGVRETLTSHATAASYSAGQRPTLSATNGSGRSGECLHFVVQRRTSVGWKPVTTSGCRTTDRSGIAAWRPTTAKPGVHYRFRTSFAGDALDQAGRSTWTRYRMRSS